MSNYYLCDTCARLIEYEPGDFVIQDADMCPLMSNEKKVISDFQQIGDVCKRYVGKVKR